MASESADSSDSDGNWLQDLELAVASGCDFNTVRMLAENRCLNDTVRAQTWQILLGVAHKPNPFVGSDELFNLPQQLEIRNACNKICESLGNAENERLSITSDLESVITLFCKTTNVSFTSDNGWTDILQLLVALKLPRAQLYHLFYAFTTKYVANNCSSGEQAYNLLRLFLLYHEPELCAFLDSKRLSPSKFSKSWFTSLFCSCCDLKVALKLWDVYLQHADPFEIFFMALVVLINAKEKTMALQNADGEEIASSLSSLPASLREEDIEDFYTLVQFYMNKTPQSYRRDYHGSLFGTNFTEMAEGNSLPALCLPISPQELLAVVMGVKNQNVNYVFVDTRPNCQFTAGHMPNAYALDATLLLADPERFSAMVEELEKRCQSNFVEFHWCLMSSGLEADDSLCNMCIAFLLKRNKRYIAFGSGGYEALHKLLKGGLLQKLELHDARRCLVCLEEGGREIAMSESDEFHVVTSAFDLLDTASQNVFAKSAKVLHKLKKALHHHPSKEKKMEIRHVSPSSRHGKGYRGQQSVFSIADDGDDISDEQSCDELDDLSASLDTVTLSSWLKADDVTAWFTCKQLEKGGRFVKSILALKGDSLYALRLLEDDEDEAIVRSRHPLSTVGKITSRRMFPELLSFTFCPVSMSGKQLPTKVEKYVVDKAGDCARMVKEAILLPKQ